MATVDEKGRIVLPKDVRERLGITPGTEVTVRVEDGTAVVEPEDDPERIIERMEQLIEAASLDRDTTRRREEETQPLDRKHADRIRRGADRGADDDG